MNPIHIQISENYAELPEKQLRQTARLRHRRQSRRQLAKNSKAMRRDPFGYVSFYVFALKRKNVVGFAYFCRNESDAAQWYYGDLVVRKTYRYRGIATELLEQGIRALKAKNAAKLVTYIDYGNEGSLAFHQKMSFARSERQQPFNGLLMEGRAVYEHAL